MKQGNGHINSIFSFQNIPWQKYSKLRFFCQNQETKLIWYATAPNEDNNSLRNKSGFSVEIDTNLGLRYKFLDCDWPYSGL